MALKEKEYPPPNMYSAAAMKSSLNLQPKQKTDRETVNMDKMTD